MLTWNVQGAFPPQGSPSRITDQVDFIRERAGCPDLLLLTEVTTKRRRLWHEKLVEDAGYEEIVDTLDWALELRDLTVPPHQDFNHSNGNLIAVHEDSTLQNLTRNPASINEGQMRESKLKHWDTNFPEKILNATVDYSTTTIDLWNIRTVPGSMYGEEKIKILENTYHRILEDGAMPRVLAGDFNAPKDETADGEVVPWRSNGEGVLAERWQKAERDILTGLDAVGMIDVFRDINGYGEIDPLDVSHPTSNDEQIRGKRFDHILASDGLNPVDCGYDERGLECSDHAPLIASFDPEIA